VDENRIKITWYGTASVRIASENSQLLIDPFIPFPDSRVKIPADAYSDCCHILVSHGHYDHIGSIREIVRRDTAVYCTKAPYTTLCRKGVRKRNLHLIKAGAVLTVGDFKITAYKGNHIRLNGCDCLKALCSRRVRKNHRGILKKVMKFTLCLEKKETLCYLVEAFGKRILILGSLALADGITYPVGADLAFFPYQGSDKLCETAEEIYERLMPKAVLLTHFDDTFPPFSTEVDTSEIEEQLKGRTRVYKLRQGSSIII